MILLNTNLWENSDQRQRRITYVVLMELGIRVLLQLHNLFGLDCAPLNLDPPRPGWFRSRGVYWEKQMGAAIDHVFSV